ncbi:MAG: hypothetical protein ABWZ56_00395 [Flavobacterium sp.]
MKKIFLFMLVSLLTLSLNSCSKDNDSTPAGSSLTMKVGGVQKTFNTITVNEIPYDDYVDLIITASNNGSTSEFVTFGIGKGDMGAGHSWGFEYTLNDVVYTEGDVIRTISSNATANSDNKLVGTFSGTVTSGDNATIELSQGSFDISY